MAFTAISKPTLHFNTKAYTGNSGTQSITGIGFQPDIVWTKKRDGTDDHNIFDAVRGVTKEIRPNKTDYEDTASNGLTAFDSDGYSIGSWGLMNQGHTYVSWNWKAGGAGSANTTGTINSTATSANTTSGVSIVKWTGTGSAGTIGHGLGAIPRTIWMKRLDNTAAGWVIYHADRGTNKYFRFDTNAVEATDTNIFNNTAPTSTVFSVGTDTDNNGNGGTYVAYVFAEKYGFSRFGSYTGTGAANSGPFCYCGFSPAFVMVKKATGSTDSWFINDNKRAATPGHNPNSYYMRPNENSAEGTSASLAIDIKGTGFKIKNTDTAYNHDGSVYLYWAFAGETLVGSNNICSLAK